MARCGLVCHASDKPELESIESNSEGELEKERVLLSSIVKVKMPDQLPPSGPPPDEEPPEESETSSLELRLLLALLVENGGITGSVAVALGFFCKVDPFGAFAFSSTDIGIGILFALPLILLDALYQLPDYSSDPDEVKSTMRLLLRPDILARLQEEQRKLSSSSKGDSADETESYKSVEGSIRVSVESISQAPLLSPVAGLLRRGKVSLDLLQQFYTRNNPAIGLRSIWSEGLVITLACLADEALYRAVLLTLLSLWIRDRIFESGLDVDLDAYGSTETSAQWASLGVGVSAGVIAFTLRAVREQAAIEKSRAQAQLMVEEAKAKSRTPKSLPGWEKPSTKAAEKQLSGDMPLNRLPDDLVSDASACIADGMASMPSTVWLFEGFREVLQVGLSGASFIVTGNLASSYFGSLAVQGLFSFYQRRNLNRLLRKRREQQQELASIRRKRASEAAAKNEEVIKRALEDDQNQKNP